MTIAQQLSGNNFKYSGGSNATWKGGPTGGGMSMAGYGAVAGAVGSIAGAIGSHYAQSSAYKVKETEAKTQAMLARLQGDADALALLQDFNRSRASDTVMAAAQGRSGGSVDAIAASATKQYNWDTDFSKLSAEMRAEGYVSQAEQYKLAGEAEMRIGSLSAIASGAQQLGTSLYSIGGSTQGEA